MSRLEISDVDANHQFVLRLTDAALAAEICEALKTHRQPLAKKIQQIGSGPARKLAECEAEIQSWQEKITQAQQRRDTAEANLAKALQARDEKQIEACQWEIEKAEADRTGAKRSEAIWADLKEKARQEGAEPIREQLDGHVRKLAAKIGEDLEARIEAAIGPVRQIALEVLALRRFQSEIINLIHKHPDDVLSQYGAQPLGTKPVPKRADEPTYHTEVTTDSRGHRCVRVA